MGIDPQKLPDHVKDKIADPKEKKRVGPTWTEKVAKEDVKTEKQLRNKVISFCRRHQLIVISPSTAKRSTIQPGAPDLTICGPINRALLMELKVGANTLSTDQKEFSRLAEAAGCNYFEIRDYDTATNLIKTHFNLKILPEHE